MSLETFKEEFYPIDASQGDIMSDLEATEACLLKWTGLLSENLKKHDVELDWAGDVIGLNDSDGSFGKIWITGETCHLCELAYRNACNACSHSGNSKCNYCPIVKHFGVNCDAEYREYRKVDSSKNPPHDPRKMIELLKKTLDALIAEQQQKQQEQQH